MAYKQKISIGSWVTLAHFSIAEIMADAGFDWLCIDMEHSVIDYYETEQLIAAIQAKGIMAYVRVGENNTRIIKRVLDAGADGIIVPMVNSKEDAIKAIDAVKYPPKGKRGVGLARAQGYGFSFKEYERGKAEDIKLIIQIEHVDSVRNLDKILKLEGIDATFVGPYDLSGSMGKPGRYDDADVKEVLKRYEEISRQCDKPMGYHVIQPDHKLILEKIKAGYTFIAFSLDTLFLGTLCRDQLNHLHDSLQSP